jgi:hypothetical protein
VYIDQKCWIPLGVLPKTINQNLNVPAEGPSLRSVLIQLTVFNKDRLGAKLITIKKLSGATEEVPANLSLLMCTYL